MTGTINRHTPPYTHIYLTSNFNIQQAGNVPKTCLNLTYCNKLKPDDDVVVKKPVLSFFSTIYYNVYKLGVWGRDERDYENEEGLSLL